MTEGVDRGSDDGAVRFMQLADPQLGMYRSLSRRSPEKRAEVWRRFRRVKLVGPEDPEVPEGVTDLRPELARLSLAVAEANRTQPAFVAICGDLVNNPDQDDQARAFRACVGALHPDIPLRCVPGNHDLSTNFKRPTSDGLSAYRAQFGDDYYVFPAGDATVLALNSETLYGSEDVPGEDVRQLEFVADTLSARPTRESGELVVLMHRPLVVRAPTPRGLLSMSPGRRMLYTLLEGCGRKVTVFCGHLHQNRYLALERFEQVISGPVGFPLRGVPGWREVYIGASVRHRYRPFPDAVIPSTPERCEPA